jgi:hypothetical protein
MVPPPYTIPYGTYGGMVPYHTIPPIPYHVHSGMVATIPYHWYGSFLYRALLTVRSNLSVPCAHATKPSVLVRSKDLLKPLHLTTPPCNDLGRRSIIFVAKVSSGEALARIEL